MSENTVAAALAKNVRQEVGKVIVGMGEAIESLLIAFLTGGHVIMEGIPGLAKTLLAKSFAMSLGLKFKRIQFTSDILPSDIIGGLVFNRRSGELEFRPGPIFANIVLIDEINRAPPRSQSALLEAMQERQVTVEGVTHNLPDPFLVVATQNPIELEGTFPLPEAEVDRFMMRVIVPYPTAEEERQILAMKNVLGEDIPISPAVDIQTIKAAMEEVRNVALVNDVINYIVEVVSASRRDNRLVLGASTRAEIALLYAAKAYAALNGRMYVIPDDVKKVFFRVLNHRIQPKPEYSGLSKSPDYNFISKTLNEYLNSVEVPL
ncbi:MAG: MoxR family ATPase [Candidatus Caldarchaeum sp.]|nr:MoxR family ATPase [Candidatus Caldarchaeum sp.]MCS7137006.1 MoxR family ATPase [Candidatus Caldarchaeum sp.]MDW7978570.1 MoxR family ATPase [Candidatus Caldarchaeum sp.]MDW8359095.1 MoxR family ATPase [Candidatus Caldarchaeum sp.]